MRIDSHQHFWKFDADRHSWIGPTMKAIKHDFQPNDLAYILQQQEIDGTILVQVDQIEQENEDMLAHARQHNFIKGIVGWVDLAASNLPERLEYYSQYPHIKGFRHILQGENTAEFLLNPAFLAGIDLLKKYQYSYDVLIYHHQMDDAIGFIKQFPEQAFVLDHIAKPDIKNENFKPWAKKMQILGQFPNLYCKLSGMVTENDWNLWVEADFEPYMQVALEAFGPERLMFGSDWPVCMLAASYSQVFDIVKNFTQKLSIAEQTQIWGQTAEKFYRI